MKTTLEIPDDLFRQAKAMAVLEGIKLKDFVAESLQLRVDAQKRTARSAKGEPRLASLHARFKKYCGVVNSGVGDLSTNPKHLDGLGED